MKRKKVRSGNSQTFLFSCFHRGKNGHSSNANILIIFALCNVFFMAEAKIYPHMEETSNFSAGLEAKTCDEQQTPTTSATTAVYDDEMHKYGRYSNPYDYVQIACNIFRKSYSPDAQNHLIPTLIPWSWAQVKRDFRGTTDDMILIPRYDGMCSVPSHTNYFQDVNGYFNTYCPLGWIPQEGTWTYTETMLRHIFGDQYEYALDYLQLLYYRPTQMLPILVLVSRERNTGKTTFLNYLKEMFGPNMVFVSNDAMRSRFNADWASRLIVGVDETLLSKKEDSERLKSLSTALKTSIEYKGQDRYEIDNFVKIVLCSNNIYEPVYIDRGETRFWVRQVPVLTKDVTDMKERLREEIPAFLFYLNGRSMKVPEALSRMWFRSEDLMTAAQQRIIQSCRPSSEIELAEFLIDIMDKCSVDVLRYTSTDITNILRTFDKKIKDAHRIICKQWCIPHAGNKLAYDLVLPYAPITRCYGRFYTIERAFLMEQIPSLDDMDNSVST